jgi:hypothetical protein
MLLVAEGMSGLLTLEAELFVPFCLQEQVALLTHDRDAEQNA